MVGMSLKWLEGTRNKNTRRIAYEIPVKTGDYSNYDEVIDKALPVVNKRQLRGRRSRIKKADVGFEA